MRLKRSNIPRMIAAVLYVCIRMICISTCLFTPVLSTECIRMLEDLFVTFGQCLCTLTEIKVNEKKRLVQRARPVFLSTSLPDSRRNSPGDLRFDEQTSPSWSLERRIWLTWMSKWLENDDEWSLSWQTVFFPPRISHWMSKHVFPDNRNRLLFRLQLMWFLQLCVNEQKGKHATSSDGRGTSSLISSMFKCPARARRRSSAPITNWLVWAICSLALIGVWLVTNQVHCLFLPDNHRSREYLVMRKQWWGWQVDWEAQHRAVDGEILILRCKPISNIWHETSASTGDEDEAFFLSGSHSVLYFLLVVSELNRKERIMFDW